MAGPDATILGLTFEPREDQAVPSPATAADPDHFLNFGTPGAQEWWYFDAITDDGRDALVLVWYAGLPFDPAYGLATLRHLKRPRRFPAPDPLDHCALGISWYRDGKTVAYALNAYRREAFAFSEAPIAVEIAGNRMERGPRGYRLRVDTPGVDGTHRLRADLDFVPAAGTQALRRNLGSSLAPHDWILAAADCRVAGRVVVAGPSGTSLEFQGRGYHDHNAGSEELSLAMKRWEWGRVHDGTRTWVYYRSEPRHAPVQTLSILLQDGRPVEVRDDAQLVPRRQRRNAFGVRYTNDFDVCTEGSLLRVRHGSCVDNGPFYMRWLSEFASEAEEDGRRGGIPQGLGEMLATGNLHRPWFNWMIPYRLKRPSL